MQTLRSVQLMVAALHCKLTNLWYEIVLQVEDLQVSTPLVQVFNPARDVGERGEESSKNQYTVLVWLA